MKKTDTQIFKDYCDKNGWSIGLNRMKDIEQTYEYQCYYISVRWNEFKEQIFNLFRRFLP